MAASEEKPKEVKLGALLDPPKQVRSVADAIRARYIIA